ncbi:hypothetical protein CASFOL_019921 [Castilleja foliolosa]|uniref:NAC domain-containing protein n=1 Tax=Castilleja foliolosa TaxID=1961234 RepID=A0ABD3D239_9LAMI
MAMIISDMIPFGYRFIPTNEELIEYYLLRRAKELPIHFNRHILNKPLYGENSNPSQVFRDVDDSNWVISEGNDFKEVDRVIYVFTKLSKINNGKTRISRRAGNGTWKGQTGGKNINNGSGQLIGSMKMYSFDGKGDGHHWIMHEYSLAGIYEKNNNDYVICKIKRVSKRKELGGVQEDVKPPCKKVKAEPAVSNPSFVGPTGSSIEENVSVLAVGRFEQSNSQPLADSVSDHRIVSTNLEDSASDAIFPSLDDMKGPEFNFDDLGFNLEGLDIYYDGDAIL